jgi:hypothetical protein
VMDIMDREEIIPPQIDGIMKKRKSHLMVE